MKSRLFPIALCTAALLSAAAPALSQTVVTASQYFPLSPGAVATFLATPSNGLYTDVVSTEQVNIHDVLTRHIADEYGTRDYFAVDSEGVRWLRSDVPAIFGDEPGTPDAVMYFRQDRSQGSLAGIRLLGPTITVPSVTNINTSAHMVPAAGFDPNNCDGCHTAPKFNIQGTAAAQAVELVSVAAGTFEALRVQLDLTLRDSANNVVGTQSSLMWFGNGVGRIKEQDLTDNSTVDLTWSSIVQPQAPAVFAATLPTSRSVQVGVPATVFATIINSSNSQTATGCRIQPLPNIPANFAYQATNPSDNSLIPGTLNTAVDIAPTKAQSFVIALTPTGVFGPTDVRFGFTCTNTNVAPINIGLDTLLLSGSSTPVPDVIALGATLKNDGIVDIPGTTGTGVFAVAAANVGSEAAITVSADTGSTSLPMIAVTLCQTDPGTGQCISARGPSVTTTIAAGGTPTFAIEVKGNGTVPFDPTANRIFVRFRDGANVVRGATSVAVRTN